MKKADNIYGYVSCMVYNTHLMEMTKKYMIGANVGKRLVVSGETGFATAKSQVAILLISNMTFVDDFVDKEEFERGRPTRRTFQRIRFGLQRECMR